MTTSSTAPVGVPGWGTPRRWAVFATGCTALIAGIATSIAAGLGVGSWQVLETGLVGVTGAPFGAVIIVEALVCLAVAWAVLGQRPWIATAVLAGAGVPIGVLLGVLPEPAGLTGQIGMFAVGTALIAVGVAFYLASDMGASAQDALFVGIYRRWTIRPGVVRFGMDAVLVAGGIALGGQFGVGTFAATLAIPVLIEPALRVGHRLAGTPLPAAMRRGAGAIEVIAADLADDAADPVPCASR